MRFLNSWFILKENLQKDIYAGMYMRVSYQIYTVEKSLGIQIEFDKWDSAAHHIVGQSVHEIQIKQKTEEYKQKVMGAFYMLTQHGGEFTLREIMDAAFANAGTKIYSLFGVFKYFPVSFSIIYEITHFYF